MLNKSVKKETIKNKDGNIIEIREYNEYENCIQYKNSDDTKYLSEYEYYKD